MAGIFSLEKILRLHLTAMYKFDDLSQFHSNFGTQYQHRMFFNDKISVTALTDIL